MTDDKEEEDATPKLDKPDKPRSTTAWDLLVTLDDIKDIEAAFEKAGMEIHPILAEHINYVKRILEPLEAVRESL